MKMQNLKSKTMAILDCSNFNILNDSFNDTNTKS